MAALDARDGIRQWVPCYNQTTTEHDERQATTKSTSRLFSHIFSAELAHQQLVQTARELWNTKCKSAVPF